MAGNNGFILQPRDRHLLHELAILEVADCEQIKVVAGFGSTTRANTRLLQLVRAGLLRRFFLGSGGGRKALYALSQKGAYLVDVPYRGPRRRQDEVLVADYYIAHQLAINEVYCTLKYKAVPGVAFERWVSFRQPVTPSLGLIPDGLVELRTASGIVSCFLEVDLGHESLSIWQRKAKNYLQLALSGDFRKQFGQAHFRVLVLVNSERRLHSIRKTLAAVTEKIIWLATIESASSSFFSSIWFRPVGDQPKPFFEINQ
jgi:hypothetical protein